MCCWNCRSTSNSRDGAIGYPDFTHAGPEQFAPRFAAGDQVLVTVERMLQGPYALIRRSALTGKHLTSSGVPPGGDYLLAFAVSPQGTYAAALWGGSARLFDTT